MAGGSVLIETLWNVKQDVWDIFFLADAVLIETLWNVKELIYRQPKGKQNVLIETLWNVKSGAKFTATIREKRINRNIVECKDH